MKYYEYMMCVQQVNSCSPVGEQSSFFQTGRTQGGHKADTRQTQSYHEKYSKHKVPHQKIVYYELSVTNIYYID